MSKEKRRECLGKKENKGGKSEVWERALEKEENRGERVGRERKGEYREGEGEYGKGEKGGRGGRVRRESWGGRGR